ncbi:uncharacterized protein LOC663019 isoform X3 [Tribolium castaneum]|uniref:uncharacterized protein LOC663019 isoform X3 n=1 Tax=Tribolium castaneum TaxID=7070 RepID=UPI00046C093B|nr:PREDICTED: restriction of telomere capping protein 5 isoform X3 [Tribolium castaneum]|eukprot:XP_008194661.1 PREDICTED: restriction of telomere capping protein 5 isoform X3 [Tribolium castaneum]
MGNHHGHGPHSKSGDSTPTSNGSRKSISRTVSNHEIQADKPSALLPVEKLTKILADKSFEEEHITGISLNVFTKCLFPRYPVLAEKLYTYLLTGAKSRNTYIDIQGFKLQCEKYLSFQILDDETVRDTFVRMFGTQVEDAGEVITPEGLRSLLMCAYHVSMDHYSEGPQMCLSISKTLKAVVDSCFHTKTQLSTQFVSHWLAANCPRLLLPLHRYLVHSLATSWRTLEDMENAPAAGLELATPVLEQAPPFSQKHPHLLHMSMSWLLAGALPPVFSRPQKAHSPSNSGVGLASTAFLTKLLCSVPSHWVVLYDSDNDGLGANRFLHHVMSYKGPTLCLLRVEDGQVFCIASPNEWRESNHYWGGEDSAVFQLLPKFVLLEKGSKMLYLNTTVRGYPYGLRAGKDPRSPIIIVDGGFEKMEFKKIPYSLLRIEVWGCGDPISREQQLEVKKWEVKEAERQRCVKLSADDWLDHPDRYLLELAGRPQYHQNQTQ